MKCVTKYLYILLLIILSSCAVRSVYIPVTQNTPLFDKSRQLTGAAYIGSNHIELHVAHNPVNHIAVGANVNYGAGIATYDVIGGFYSYTKSSKLRYEFLTGYGYNSNTSYQTNIPSLLTGKNVDFEVNARFHKYYIQPAIGYFGEIKMYKIKYSFSFSARLGLNYFTNYTYREIDNTNAAYPVYVINKQYNNSNLFTFEPCITNKVGIKNIYAVLQLQSISPYSQEIDVRYTKFSQGLLLSVGLQYNLKFKNSKP